MLITRVIRMSQKMADLKNNVDEKLDAVKKELANVKDSVRDSIEKYRTKILDDPKYFFIPALIGSLLSLSVISVLVLTDRNPLEKFNNGATTDLERRLQDFSKDTQEALELMLGRFKEEILEEFGDQYGCGPHHKFKKVAITFFLGLHGLFSFYSVLKGSY